MSSLELMVYRLNIQARAQTWADLEPAELRRRAVEAARDGDMQALWDMTEAYVLLQGLAGARVSEHTLRAYRTGVALFTEYARPAGVQLLRPRPNHGVAYARWLEAKGLSTSSVRVRLAAACSLYAALRWAGATDAVPFADVRPGRDPVVRTEKRKPYSPDDLTQLLAHAHPEEAVMVLLGAHAGLRSSEIAGLPRTDLHLDEPEPFLVVTGKRQKRQSVPLSGTLTLALRRCWPCRPVSARRCCPAAAPITLRNGCGSCALGPVSATPGGTCTACATPPGPRCTLPRVTCSPSGIICDTPTSRRVRSTSSMPARGRGAWSATGEPGHAPREGNADGQLVRHGRKKTVNLFWSLLRRPWLVRVARSQERDRR